MPGSILLSLSATFSQKRSQLHQVEGVIALELCIASAGLRRELYSDRAYAMGALVVFPPQVMQHIGIVWQVERYDRIVRNHQEFINFWEYIRQNPVKAGLTEIPEDYPFLWEEF